MQYSFVDLDGIKVIFSHEQIQSKLKEIALQIDNDYRDKCNNLVIVGILNGSIYALADLTMYMNINTEIDFMSVSSYGNELKSSGAIKINKDLGANINGKDVLIIDDIVDTGLTTKWLLSHFLRSRGAKSVEIFALLRRKVKTNEDIPIKYVGFEVKNNLFLIGYGLDFKQKYRNIDFIGAVV
jgi:hypoxanthine phosphoribosyltransferase